VGPLLLAKALVTKYGVETPEIATAEEIQDPVIRGKGDAVVITQNDLYWKAGKGMRSQQCKIQ
jgi:hypothetical protein